MSTKQAMEEMGNRRRGSAPKAGSVWESRMKLDEVKGGIKVFDATQENSDENKNNSSVTTVDSTDIQVDSKGNMKTKRGYIGAIGKRKTWKSESFEGSPLQIARRRSELSKNLDEQCRELSVSADGVIKKSPVQIKKTRSVSSQKGISDQSGKNLDESSDKNVKNSVSIQLVKEKPVESRKILDENAQNSDEKRESEKRQVGGEQSGSDEDCKKIVVCEDKAITNISGNVGRIITPSDDDFLDGEEDGEIDKKIEVEVEKKSLGIKEITVEDSKPKKIVISNEKRVPIKPIVKKQAPPVTNHATIHTIPTKTNPIPVSDDSQKIPRSHSKLQSFVDLVMWREVSRSAFVFGLGTFLIISSSYTKDLNISFISVISYMGLVYLAAIFLFRSLICRGAIGMDNASQNYVVGEEEATWLLKLILPYINEFLLKMRALFSGDPATTMKLAVLLFVLARCGSSITIWKMAKLGFFGVFIVPKVCSSYSVQLTAYGIFWTRRFRDAWESCTHKKAVGFAIFTLVWNLSSMVARIWAVFMLFVAFKYYQHSLMKGEWTEEEARNEDSWQAQGQGGRLRSTPTETRKLKKPF